MIMIKKYFAIYNYKLKNYYDPILKSFGNYNTNNIYKEDDAKEILLKDNLKDCELKSIYKYFKS